MARILVADDDPIMRKMLREMLAQSGHETVEASDGDEALERQREEPADLVITDILMPGKEGLETIRDFQREFPDIKIIAISGGGFTGKDYLPLARELGASHAFSKPFSQKQMLTAVNELLEEDR